MCVCASLLKFVAFARLSQLCDFGPGVVSSAVYALPGRPFVTAQACDYVRFFSHEAGGPLAGAESIVVGFVVMSDDELPTADEATVLWYFGMLRRKCTVRFLRGIGCSVSSHLGVVWGSVRCSAALSKFETRPSGG